MSVHEYFERLFIVRKCVACREILDYKSFYGALCPKCRLAFEVAKSQSCPECAKAACECTCQPSMLAKEGSLALRKLFFYSSSKDTEAQNRLVYFLKHQPNKRGFDFCAEQIWEVLKGELDELGIYPSSDAFITNVPRSRKSVREYGFDQSHQICEALSKRSEIPFVKAILRKSGGKEQKRLTAAQRRKNVSGKMRANDDALAEVQGKYAILFDDIVTTGASMSACIKALRKMKVSGVICVALATDLKNKSAR